MPARWQGEGKTARLPQCDEYASSLACNCREAACLSLCGLQFHADDALSTTHTRGASLQRASIARGGTRGHPGVLKHCAQAQYGQAAYT